MSGRRGVRGLSGSLPPAVLAPPIPQWGPSAARGREPLPRHPHAVPAAHSVTSLCRWAWHSMVTATGSEVMWQGYASRWIPSAVVSPP